MRGSSAEEVAERVLSQPSLAGLQVNQLFKKKENEICMVAFNHGFPYSFHFEVLVLILGSFKM